MVFGGACRKNYNHTQMPSVHEFCTQTTSRELETVNHVTLVNDRLIKGQRALIRQMESLIQLEHGDVER